MIEAIKYWDDVIVQSHVNSEIDILTKYLDSKNITEISYIDIGANVGKFYDILSKKYKIKKVIMVEPNPLLYQYMEKKYANNLECYIFNYAISDEDCKTYFDTSAMDYFANNVNFQDINLGLSKINRHGGTEIDALSASSFFDKHVGDTINKIDFIKIDTENRDYNILKSITEIIKNSINKPYIVLEHNYHNDMSYDDAKNIYENFMAVCNYDGLQFDDLSGSVYLTPKI